MQPPAAAGHLEARIAPVERNVRNPTYCPLCGFLLADNLDGHFVPCLLARAFWVWISPRC